MRLWGALGEIVQACRAKALAALSAIVVRKEGGKLEYPGAGYYTVAHPNEAGDVAKAAIAWANELQKVKQTVYPLTL